LRIERTRVPIAASAGWTREFGQGVNGNGSLLELVLTARRAPRAGFLPGAAGCPPFRGVRSPTCARSRIWATARFP